MRLRSACHRLTELFSGFAARFSSGLRGTGSRRPPEEWLLVPEGWDYARHHPEVRGWNVSSVLRTQQEKWTTFVSMLEDTGPLGFTHEAELTDREDVYCHNTVMSFAYVLALSALGRRSISLLDWGGGIGHAFALATRLLPGISVDYHCMDVPLLAKHGQRLFPGQHFSSDEECLEREYDLVVASGSLLYWEEWHPLARRLARSTGRYLLLTSVPVIDHAASFVFLQRAHSFGYETEYLGWCFNRHELVSAVEDGGLRLVRELIVGYRLPIVGAPEQNVLRGFVFRAPQAGRPDPPREEE